MTPFGRFLARSVTAAILLVALNASSAAAQAAAPSAPFTQAQSSFLFGSFSQVAQGRELWITTTNGARVKGYVDGMISTGLNIIDKGGGRQTIKFEDISLITKSTHRVRTHTFIGLGIGAGFGALGLLACGGDSECSFLIATYAGIGAGIGALNGAIKNSLNRDDDLIYVAGARTTKTRSIAPVFTKLQKSVSYVVSWR